MSRKTRPCPLTPMPLIVGREPLVRLRRTLVFDRARDLRWDWAASASLRMLNMPFLALFEACAVGQSMLRMPLPVQLAPHRGPTFTFPTLSGQREPAPKHRDWVPRPIARRTNFNVIVLVLEPTPR